MNNTKPKLIKIQAKFIKNQAKFNIKQAKFITQQTALNIKINKLLNEIKDDKK